MGGGVHGRCLNWPRSGILLGIQSPLTADICGDYPGTLDRLPKSNKPFILSKLNMINLGDNKTFYTIYLQCLEAAKLPIKYCMIFSNKPESGHRWDAPAPLFPL